MSGASRWHRFALAMLLAVLAAAAAAQSAPPGWIAHHRPGGELFVPHPRGWQVEELGDGVFSVQLRAAGGALQAQVYVRPLQLRNRALSDALAQFPRQEKQRYPDARISVRPEHLTDRSILGALHFTLNGSAHRGALLLVAAPDGHGAQYAISATEAAWPAQRQVMAGILKGFAYLPRGGTAVQRPAALPPMQTWREPNEGAYTMPVPAGWQVHGGMVRPGIERRDEVVVVSPDGAIQLRIGDISVPNFTLPYAIPGIGAPVEGSAAAGGLVVMRYLPGAAFLTQLYLPQKFGRLPPLQVQELPALALQSYQQQPPAPPMQGRVDAGAVTFELQTPAGPRRAWYLAVTRYQEAPALPGSAHWWVDTLVGSVCAPGSEAQAHAILAAMKRGLVLDPRWVAAELQMRGQITQQIVEHNRWMNDSVARLAETRAQGMAQAQAPLQGAARGEIRVQGADGQVLVVPQTGSHDYYRVRNSGEVIATDRGDLPAVDFDRLWRLP
jgi:hypothetical protein